MEYNDIIKFVDENENSLGMSDFQSRYFVVNSQVTDYRRVRQALIEIDTRIGSQKQIERQRRKRMIEKQILERDIANEPDELKKQLIQVDIDQAEWDIHMYDKKEVMVQNELNNFVNMVKAVVPNLEALQQFGTHNEQLEREYWVTRMAKQAAMDLNTIGRISQGNLDSILMMPMPDVKETLGLAIKYNGVLGKGLDAIGQATMKQLIGSKGTDLAYIDDVAKDQLKIEAKTKSENI
jgi:hypothetical protein